MDPQSKLCNVFEIAIVMLAFFVLAGDLSPSVNEAHYLVKAKNFWQPDWCSQDLFAASGKAHVVFYTLMGWPTLFCSLEATAWMGRCLGWLVVAVGISRLCRVSAAHFGYSHHWIHSVGVVVIWLATIQHGNLAGEWVIGGIEGKVPAYGFLLLGIACLLNRDWNWVWIWFGIASSFHVLTGGWAVIAAVISWFVSELLYPADDGTGPRRLVTWWLLAGGLLALPGIIPAVMLTAKASPEISTEAAKIYVYSRIRHHLLPSAFELHWYLRYGVVLLITGYFAARVGWPNPGGRRLVAFASATVIIAVAGIVLGFLPAYAPELAARWLRYYWFRLADAAVPLSLALMVVAVISVRKSSLQREAVDQWAGRLAVWVLVACSMLFVLSSIRRIALGVPPSVDEVALGRRTESNRDDQLAVWQDWKRVCRWAKESTPDDEVFLTPRHQQTFKWYAERAEVVNWKDVPQDAVALTEWQNRFGDVFPARLGHVRVSIGYATLRRFRARYGVRYMIVDRQVVGTNLPLVRLYPLVSEDNLNYAVYELPQ